MTEQPLLDPMRAFAEIGRIELGQSDLPTVLDRLAELAKSTIPGAAEVSVTLVRAGKASTAAFTGDLALELDERQYEGGQGPCLAAAQGGETVVVVDVASEKRWPFYTREALRRGALSSVSVGIPVQEAVVGALNIYGATTAAFDDDAIELAQTFASYAAVALANAHLYLSTANLARGLEDALSSRAVIEQAKGILMAQQGCTSQEAFDILVRASQQSNRKLRDIADALVQQTQSAAR